MRYLASLRLAADAKVAPVSEGGERFRAPIYRIALRMLGDAHEAEDVAQEVLFQLSQKRPHAQLQQDLGAWATCLTLNRCRDILRSHRRQRVDRLDPQLVDFEDAQPRADAVLDRAQREHNVQRALQGLPEQYREVLVLRDLEGQPYRRICEILGLPETNLKSRVIRARAALADALEKLGAL